MLAQSHGGHRSDHLFHNRRAMLSHSVHDRQGSTLPRRAGGFGSHRQRINQRLWMMFSDIRQEAVDIPTNVDAWCLNSCYDLIVLC